MQFSALRIFDAVFYPAECLLCGQAHESEKHWLCPTCYAGLCERPVAGEQRLMPEDDRGLRVFSCWHFDDPVQELVHGLKYRRHFSLVGQLGEAMRKRIAASGWPLLDYAFVPVPLHRRRLEERGFNQSEKIARALTGRRQINRVLRRIRYTPSQTTLRADQRHANVAEAFALKRGVRQKIAGGRFILIDDVFTTGATLQACARVLLKAGAEDVRAITLARAGGNAENG